jgi:hypothetical protein
MNAVSTDTTSSQSGSLTMQFAAAARLLNAESQRFGLDAPSFRSPPRVVGVDRTVRRRDHGGVVAVALRDRPFVAVLGDMIEGVIVVNRLVAPIADQVRTALWAILSLRGFISTDFYSDASSEMRSDHTQTRVA